MTVSKSTLWAWSVRLAWVAVGVTAERALRLALATTSGAGDTSARIVAAVFWIAGAVAVAVPSVRALTATRVIIPTSLVAAITIAFAAGPDSAWVLASIVAALAATIIVASAGLGRVYVQSSAYGEEDRHLLRPPAAYLIASVVTWAVWAGLAVGATVAIADERWALGAVLAILAAGAVAWGWRRWHRLSRRWLVFVPIGIVLHDHVVLSDTWMIRRQELAGMRLAPADTGAADLTGPATGHAVELLLSDTLTVVTAGTPAKPAGTALHLTAALIAPTRPGETLRAAAARRLTATADR